jgi:hypothetical protein
MLLMDNSYDILFHKGSVREGEDDKISDMVGLVSACLGKQSIHHQSTCILHYQLFTEIEW